MTHPLRVEAFSGERVHPLISDLARLRITVFREFPYLYDGSLEYEQRYLRHLSRSAGSVVVGVLDGARLVGASTGMPLADEAEGLQQPLLEGGFDLETVFYCAESVLLRPYRGRGMYRAFFAEREAHARRLGFSWSVFCAVERPADHPRRPPGYTPLDGIWMRLGYTLRPDLRAELSWRDLDEEAETPKPMVYWLKPLEEGRG
ncbi:MAG: hypothetical protein SCH98_06170 [Deferrisomatales bacterium]|nr:hypothetical protein [Deferrisomatales bacterium]